MRIVGLLGLWTLTCLCSPHALAQKTSRSRLVRVLTGRSEKVRMGALVQLRSQPEKLLESLPDLLVALDERVEVVEDEGQEVPPSLVEMLDLLGTVDQPEAERALIGLLDCESADVAMISADVLGRNQFFSAIDALHGQIRRPAYQQRYAFRFNLIRALAQMKHPDAIEVLGEIEPTLDGQLRFEVGKILEEVTLGDFRGDAERYAAWRKGSEKASIFRTAKFAGEQDDPAYDAIQLGRPHYYGIEIRASRVMFIIDHSGSMKAPTSSGNRLQRAKQELIRAIRDLPEDSQFAIVAYDSNVRHWRQSLSPASEEDKRAAILYVQRLGFGNDTNTYGAVRRALDFDDSLEAVFLLTDGKPTTGPIVSPSQIVADIVHRNRWRHLKINTIGISVTGVTETFLRSLAANSGGEFKATQ